MTRATITAKANLFIQAVESGHEAPLKTYIRAKYLHEVAALVLKELKDAAFYEAEQYYRQERTVLGVDFDTRNGSTKPEFEADPEYCRLKALLKQREELLEQATKGKGVTLDPGTGEVLKPLPVKYTAPSLVITFRK